MVYNNAYELIGKTPLIRLNKIEKYFGLKSSIYAKVESFNPAGSIKDRAAYNMIIQKEKRGELKKGSIIIEPTSGNTGIGIASISAQRGYRCILVMPESMSIERRKLLKAYGAEIILTPASLGMKGSIAKALELSKELPNSQILGQFDNYDNVLAHYNTTAREIYQDLNGEFDYFVAGVGTGGTIMGCSKYFKEMNKDIKIVAVEPKDSPYLSEGRSGAHKIQGIGAGFVPSIVDKNYIDEIMLAETMDSYEASRLNGKLEGFLIGISSGAALSCAIKIAKKVEGKKIVVIFPDGGDHYLSTELYD